MSESCTVVCTSLQRMFSLHGASNVYKFLRNKWIIINDTNLQLK